MDTNSVLGRVKEDAVRYIQLQFSDIAGIVKSVTIPAEQLPDALEHGMWFDGSSIHGFTRIFESDMYLKPDPSTYAVVPWHESESGNTARFICDVYKTDGTPFEGDPRQALKRALAEAEHMGFQYNTGPELEFFLLKKEDGNLAPLPHDNAGYFDLTTDEAYNIRKEITEALERFGITVEASHHEVAMGQHEIDFRYAEALKTADNALTLRYVVKAIAQKHGLYATFMPKPFAGINGSGMHVHQSLFDKNRNQNAFYSENDKYNFSPIAYQFIAGQLKHIKAMCAVLSPTVNSYRRLVAGYEAPVYISWARTNRSALIRVPATFKGRTQATRVELRSPDPSCNPYLAFAVMLKAGLDGIKNNISVPNPVEENLYHFSDEKLSELHIDTLPQTLADAMAAFKQSTLMRDALGNHIYEKYIAAKKEEWDEFRLQVTSWEMEKYSVNY